jgi:hypothetical protein
MGRRISVGWIYIIDANTIIHDADTVHDAGSERHHRHQLSGKRLPRLLE